MEVPTKIDAAMVVQYACVTDDVRPTGKTRHLRDAMPVDGELVGGTLIPPARALAIAQYPGETNFYLFGLDDHGEVQSDTWHETFEDALAQAEHEYEGLTWLSPAV